MTFNLQIGNGLIDIIRPHPEHIDLDAIEKTLRVMRRWSNNPAALTVHQHRHFAAHMAIEMGETDVVVDWCLHHDDHEAIIGDIPGPLKTLIYRETDILSRIEDGLDRAICAARGQLYPDREVRQRVHLYDKASETIEWQWVLRHRPAPWNAKLPPIPEERLRELLQRARIEP